MKIAHLIWARFPVEGYGGTERVCEWLAKAQAERGHEVTILCRGGSLPYAKIVEIPDSIQSAAPYLPAGTGISIGVPMLSVEMLMALRPSNGPS